MPTLLPPPQYDHPPAIPVIEHVLPLAELSKFCLNNGNHFPALKPGQIAWGCSKNDGKVCHVWLPSREIVFEGKPALLKVERIEETRRHEYAHCNGWPHEHPGGTEQ